MGWRDRLLEGLEADAVFVAVLLLLAALASRG